MTLLELLVALAVLGVMAGVVGLAWRPRGTDSAEARQSGVNMLIAAARRRAVQSGAAVPVRMSGPERPILIVAYPDGRVMGADRFGIDPMSGRPTPDSVSRTR